MDQLMKKKRFLANIVAMYGLLSYGYYFFFYIFQNFSNKLGFELHFNGLKMVEGLIVILLMSLIYVYNDINESIYLSYTFFFYLFIIVPSASYYFLVNGSRAFFYMQILVMLILDALYLLNKKSLNRKSINYSIGRSENKLPMRIFMCIIMLFMIADVGLYLKYGHSIFDTLFKMGKTEELYKIRIAARTEVPKKFSYLIFWSAMVIVPASMAWFIKIKKYYLVILPVILQVLLFTIGGTKSHIFTLVMVAVIFVLFSEKKMEWFLPCTNLLLVFTLLTRKAIIMGIVIRRAFFFPQSISYNYYEFFKKYPQLHLSSSILRHFFHNGYKLDAPFIISRYCYKAPVMSANTNFIANSYANFGFIGVILFALILGIILVIIERISYNKIDKKYIIFITFCPYFALVNSALFTVMFTHGFIFALIMAFLFYYGRKQQDYMC